MFELAPPAFDWWTKGLPRSAEGLSGGAIAALGLDLLAGDLMMPAAVLIESALHHNICEMQAFADRIGAHVCPHGKTSMSPELLAMQVQAGAWGLTAATAHHVRIYRRLGVSRIFLANQLVAGADIDFILGELAADPNFDFYCLADSAEGVDLLAAAARRAGLESPLQLLVETGAQGGRAGVRSIDGVLSVARQIAAAAPFLALRGFETFEGIRQARPNGASEAGEMVGLTVRGAEAALSEGLLAPGPLLLSAGGSAFLDIVAECLPRELAGRPVERIIRPGCYVTHDHGLYERSARQDRRSRPGLPDLRPALEIWGAVLSLPEPGLAIVGIGKRDVSFDVDPPLPLHVHRPGTARHPRAAAGLRTQSLWDQHLSLAGVEPGALAVGDLVGFGISHPCTTFDRWRAIFTASDDYRITGAVSTLF